MLKVALPPNVKGTGRVSPLTSARLSLTENSRLFPSSVGTATPSTVTSVGSLSVTLSDVVDFVPTR